MVCEQRVSRTQPNIIGTTVITGADAFVSLSNGASFGASALWHGYFAP